MDAVNKKKKKGSMIRRNLFRIPDPGVKKAPDPRPGSATLAATLYGFFILRNRAELQHQKYNRTNHFHFVTWARLSQDRLTVTGGGRAREGGRDMVMEEGRGGGGVAPWLEEEWRERSLT